MVSFKTPLEDSSNLTNTIQGCIGSGTSDEVGVPEADIFIGLILLCCFLVGGLGHVAAFVYFLRETGNTVLLHVYKFVAFTDIGRSALVLPMLVSYFVRRQQMIFTGVLLCTFWTTLFGAFAQFSVFLVAVLSICRTMQILKPSKRVNPNGVLVIMSFAAVGFLLLNLLPAMVWDLTGTYNKNKVMCAWLPQDHQERQSLPFILINALYTGIPLLLMGVVVISHGTNIYHTYYLAEGIIGAETGAETGATGNEQVTDPTADQFSETTPAGRRAATVTILIYTMIYLVFNTHLFFAFFIDAADATIDRCLSLLKFDFPHNYLSNSVYVLAVPLNALVNFFLFFVRMPRFRKGIESQGQRGLSKVKV